MDDRENWPVHQPEAHDAPIPGRQWYGGCEPGGDWDPELGNYRGTGPRVNPETGLCESCGERACRVCGKERCPEHVTCAVCGGPKTDDLGRVWGCEFCPAV